MRIIYKANPPPPPPPCRKIRVSIFGDYETKESIKKREDYEIFMQGWNEGFKAGKEVTSWTALRRAGR